MKSRDIIPGWPRGRSTSQPMAKGSVWPWVAVYSLMGPEPQFIGVFPRMELQGLSRKPYLKAPYFDHATAAFEFVAKMGERVARQAEERRKAEMMELYWEQKRIEARGCFYPRPIGYIAFAGYLSALDHNQQLLREFYERLYK